MCRVDCDIVVPGIYEVALDLQREPEEGGRRRRVRVRMMSVIWYGEPIKITLQSRDKTFVDFQLFNYLYSCCDTK